MDKTIRTQAVRLIVIYSLLIALCIWQRNFIWIGVIHNVYLNGMIIGVFLFGSALVTRGLFALRNDVVAYNALKAIYEDGHAKPPRAMSDAELRVRCLAPGTVYKPSQLMGHVFDLTLDELLRSQQVKISIATMQNLLQAVDARISHQRSLNAYLTSLCIFLGLIGTFIGLMEMVASVGGIIGGLANADSGSTDTMRQLIKNLEAPLTGMAQGFSASLFGLTGSLLLGLASRFVNIAIHALREEFENWLAGISQLDTELGNNSQAGGASVDLSGVNTYVQRLGTVVRINNERLEQQIETLERACRQLERSAVTDQKTLQALARIDQVHGAIADTRDEVTRQSGALRSGMLDAFERLSRLSQEQQAATLNEIANVNAAQAQSQASLEQIANAQERSTQGAETRHAAALVELRALIAGQGQISSSLAMIDSVQSQAGQTLVQLRADAAIEATRMLEGQTRAIRELEKLGEQGSGTRAEIERIAITQGETVQKIGELTASQDNARLEDARQRAEVRAELARLASLQEGSGSLLSEIGASHERLMRVQTEQNGATLAGLSQVRAAQVRADAILTQLAALEAGQADQATVSTVVAQTVGAAVGEMARAMDLSIRGLAREIGQLVEEQQRMTEALTRGPDEAFIREIRDMSRSLQNGLSAGLHEIAQTLEATLTATATVRGSADDNDPTGASSRAG